MLGPNIFWDTIAISLVKPGVEFCITDKILCVFNIEKIGLASC
jgi:hypothetical protein